MSKRKVLCLKAAYSTGADIAAVSAELGIPVSTMATELGLNPVTIYEYTSGRSKPKRSTMLALEWVRHQMLARRASIEAGDTVVQPENEWVEM